jgi:hypothetical protein
MPTNVPRRNWPTDIPLRMGGVRWTTIPSVFVGDGGIDGGLDRGG